jgi:hypothetical protein
MNIMIQTGLQRRRNKESALILFFKLKVAYCFVSHLDVVATGNFHRIAALFGVEPCRHTSLPIQIRPACSNNDDVVPEERRVGGRDRDRRQPQLLSLEFDNTYPARGVVEVYLRM